MKQLEVEITTDFFQLFFILTKGKSQVVRL